ncbi:MAG: dihydroneopterin aldolase [Spirochaetia bacterium]
MGRTSVGIKDLEVRCIVGANSDERLREQTVHISFELEYGGREEKDPDGAEGQVLEADELRYALDYSEASDRLRAIAQEGRFVLLETLAQAAARELSRDARVARLWVECCKPAAREDVRYAYARVEWSRNA